MDARDEKRTWMSRLALGVLVALLWVGLWQGYGAWLLGKAGFHGT